MIYVIGIIFTFFLSFILLTKKGKSIPDKILVVWLFIIALHLILYYIVSTQQHFQISYLLGLEIPMPLLHGPFLFLYTTSFTAPQAKTWKKLLHLIPFAIALLSIIPFFLLSSEEKLLVYRNQGEPFSILTGIIFLGTALSGLVYIALSLRALISHKRKIKNEYSYTEKINLQWLFNLTIGLCGVWLIVLLADDEVIFSSVVLYVCSSVILVSNRWEFLRINHRLRVLLLWIAQTQQILSPFNLIILSMINLRSPICNLMQSTVNY